MLLLKTHTIDGHINRKLSRAMMKRNHLMTSETRDDECQPVILLGEGKLNALRLQGNGTHFELEEKRHARVE